MKSLFNVDKWQINQPIIKSDINTALANVKGVQSVIGFTLNNLYDSDQGYSGNIYDLTTATKNGIIYNKHYALTLETQHFPDGPNQPSFPSTLLKPGETYHQTTLYTFSTK